MVLLAGGGPFDRDESSGRNKPLKDLAWGLASRGAVVLRFDKITHAHPDHIVNNPGFTMADEYLPHAIAAVRLLARHAAVDADRIFVLGHSMGGRVAPRVAAAEPAVAGLIILAGDTQPIQWSAVRVMRHLASLTLDTAAASQALIEELTKQARLIDSDDLTASTAPDALPLGLTASYWLDARDYDPVAVATGLNKPMLILQGGRDYQVTVADDLAAWRTGLAHRPDVSIRIYDDDDHLFFSGARPSTPSGYEPAQHVDPVVIADIADWLPDKPGP
ncbi:MAG: alpha/beta hydrolase family protein [Actinocrinis sp.]